MTSPVGRKWALALVKDPSKSKDCPWEKLDGWCWQYLISYKPEFAEKCPWSKLEPWHLCNVLQRYPDFIKNPEVQRCSFCLNGYHWAAIIADHPQLEHYCDFGAFDASDWIMLLKHQPKFKYVCHWDKFNYNDFHALLKDIPDAIDDVEDAQMRAVSLSHTFLERINNPLESIIDLHKMLWVL